MFQISGLAGYAECNIELCFRFRVWQVTQSVILNCVVCFRFRVWQLLQDGRPAGHVVRQSSLRRARGLRGQEVPRPAHRHLGGYSHVTFVLSYIHSIHPSFLTHLSFIRSFIPSILCYAFILHSFHPSFLTHSSFIRFIHPSFLTHSSFIHSIHPYAFVLHLFHPSFLSYTFVLHPSFIPSILSYAFDLHSFHPSFLTHSSFICFIHPSFLTHEIPKNAIKETFPEVTTGKKLFQTIETIYIFLIKLILHSSLHCVYNLMNCF